MPDPMTTPADYHTHIKDLLEAAQLDRPNVAVRLDVWLPISEARGCLREEAPTLARAYLAACEEVERLTRVLRVEQGDESAAPEGWTLNKDGHWVKGNYRVIHPSYWALCEIGDMWFRPFDYALEAMEAADRAAEVTL